MRLPLLQRTVILAGAICAGMAIVGIYKTSTSNQPLPPRSVTLTLKPTPVGLQSPRMAKSILSSTEKLQEAFSNRIHSLEIECLTLNYEQKAFRFQDFIDSTSNNHYLLVFTLLDQLHQQEPTDSRLELQMRLLQRWCETNPREAADALSSLQIKNPTAYERVATVWSPHDSGNALAWAQSIPDQQSRQAALLAIATETMHTNPQQALALVSQTALPPEKLDIVTRAASLWAQKDPSAALAWTNQLQDKTLHDQTLASIATSIAHTDPNRAAQLVLESIAPGQTQETAILGILQHIAFTDTDAATTWASQFPSPLKQTALNEIHRITSRRLLRR